MDDKTASILRRNGIDPDRLPPGTLLGGKPLSESRRDGKKSVEVAFSPGLIRIVVPGNPQGKPRMTRRDRWKVRPATTKYHEWCDAVRLAVGDKLPKALDVVSLSWCAFFEPPASWSKKERANAIGTQHRQKPDRDNVDKAVLDCLWPSGDSAIASGTLRKLWDWNARLEIDIEVS